MARISLVLLAILFNVPCEAQTLKDQGAAEGLASFKIQQFDFLMHVARTLQTPYRYDFKVEDKKLVSYADPDHLSRIESDFATVSSVGELPFPLIKTEQKSSPLEGNEVRWMC